MPYKVPEDPLKITFLRVVPWEEAQGPRDGRQGVQLIGTKAEAEAEKRRIAQGGLGRRSGLTCIGRRF